MRIPVSSRERSTYIQLRDRGYTIGCIAEAFGRSNSVVHGVLKRAWLLGVGWRRDLRRLPRRVRELHALYSPRTLQRYLNLWESWVLSEEGDPP